MPQIASLICHREAPYDSSALVAGNGAGDSRWDQGSQFEHAGGYYVSNMCNILSNRNTVDSACLHQKGDKTGSGKKTGSCSGDDLGLC